MHGGDNCPQVTGGIPLVTILGVSCSWFFLNHLPRVRVTEIQSDIIFCLLEKVMSHEYQFLERGGGEGQRSPYSPSSRSLLLNLEPTDWQ